MYGILLTSTEAAYNLALEELLLESLTPQHAGYFLLWHNAPSIIVGRHQNTYQEINEALVARYALPVVRRMTGGGAVYHDLGNLNFSFLRPAQKHEDATDFLTFLQPVTKALQSLGVEAVFSGRNDLMCQGRKISGSAQWRQADKILHHGTLLISLDMDMLGAVLTGAPDKYISKGIQSLRSRVANIEEFLPHNVHMAEIKQTLMTHCAHEVIALDTHMAQKAEMLAEKKYRTHAWNYGASPPFMEIRRQRFAWGAVECRLDIHKERITKCKIFGDFFAQADIQDIEYTLCGVPYTKHAVATALQNMDMRKYFVNCEPTIMKDFFYNF